jgi:hypothetical protein
MGRVKTHRSGPTGIGKTLEDLLDITENNIAGPDLGTLGELKACRKNQTSMLTLFTKAPKPSRVNSKLLKTYGYPDPERPEKPVLHTTLDATRYNTVNGTGCGFKAECVNEKVNLVSNFPEQVEAYWDEKTLKKSFEKKLPKLVFVKADSFGEGKDEEFHFNEAYQLSGFSFDHFKTLLEQGMIKIDIRIGVYPNGKTHDHGTGFRVMNNRLDDLFDKKIKLL